jgi:hypothetical protein
MSTSSLRLGQSLNHTRRDQQSSAPPITFVRASQRRAAAAASHEIDAPAPRNSNIPDERTGLLQVHEAVDLEARRRKHAEIQQLAQDIEIVNQLMVDMHMMTMQQEESIELIVDRVEETHKTVEKANDELRAAAKTQRRNRGIMAGIFTTIVAGAATVGLIAALKPKIF